MQNLRHVLKVKNLYLVHEKGGSATVFILF